jgi:hypothetical protein
VRRILLAIVGVVLAVGTGVYLAGRTVVEHRASAALTEVRGKLPSSVTLEVARTAVARDLRGVILHDVRLAHPRGVVRIGRIRVHGGVWPFAPADGPIRRITAYGLRGRTTAPTASLRIGRARLRDVTLDADGVRAAAGRLHGLSATWAAAQLHLPTVRLEGVAPGRAERVYADRSVLHTGAGLDTTLRVAGLSLRALSLRRALAVASGTAGATAGAGPHGPLARLSTGRIDVVARGRPRRTVRHLRLNLRRRPDGAVAGRVRLDGLGRAHRRRVPVGRARLSLRLNAVVRPRRKQATLSDIGVDLPGGTRITGRARLDVAPGGDGARTRMGNAAQLRLVDLSLDVHGHGGVAAWLGADGDPSRAAVGGLLARELAQLANFARVADRRAQRSATVLRRFLRNGGHIHVAARPGEPVPVSRLGRLARERPAHLIGATRAHIRAR